MKTLAMALLTWFAVLAPAVAKGVEPVGLGDYFRLRRAADPQISPDASRVAYVEVTPDIATDTYRRSIRIVSLRDGRDSPVPSGGAGGSHPRWSPDGRSLAWVQRGTDGPELVVVESEQLPAGGASAVRLLARLPVAPAELAWSPDGSRLAFLAAVPVPLRETVAPAAPPGATWAARPRIYESGGFQTVTDPMPANALEVALFVVDTSGQVPPRRITAASLGGALPYTGAGLAFTADGRRVLAGLQPEAEGWRNVLQSRLYAIDLARGGVTAVAGELGGAAWSPSVARDGGVAFLCRPPTSESFIRFEICHGAGERGPFRSLAPELDRLIVPARVAPDGKGVYAVYLDRGIGRLAWFGLDGRREVLAETGGGDASAYANGGALSVAWDGTAAYLHSSAGMPSEVAVVRRGTKPRILTRLNEALLAGLVVNPVEEFVHRPADGGAEVHGFLFRPAGADAAKPLPVIALLHGGASSDYGPDFDLAPQLMAAHGYAVLLPNYRGSGSYGAAFANKPRYPMGIEADVIGAAEALVERGIADPQRLYLMGGSGGGLITGWTIGHTSRFRAAVMWYPPTDWLNYVLEAATGPTSLHSGFRAMPWEDPAEYVARAPLSRVGEVSTPTMVIIGERDRITPVSQSIAWFRALRLRGVPAELVVVPGAGHGISDTPSRAMSVMAETLGWLARHGGQPLAPTVLPSPSGAMPSAIDR